MNILEKIISNKRIEVERQQEAISISMLEKTIQENQFINISFKQALINSPAGIIAEFKRKSPSKSWIAEHAKVETIVPDYQSSGAAAISVLTDEVFFGGSFNDFKTARFYADIPLLRKDFIINEYQLYQSKAMGADVILLIAAALTTGQSVKLSTLAKQLGLEVLLEIHNEEELEYIEPNIDVVGINNRNLSTFVTDIQRSLDLGDKIPGEYVKISESGISNPASVIELRNAGFQGFLMGENFMKTNNPGNALKEFIAAL